MTVALMSLLLLPLLALASLRPQWYELEATYSFEQYAQDFGKAYAPAEVGSIIRQGFY